MLVMGLTEEKLRISDTNWYSQTFDELRKRGGGKVTFEFPLYEERGVMERQSEQPQGNGEQEQEFYTLGHEVPLEYTAIMRSLVQETREICTSAGVDPSCEIGAAVLHSLIGAHRSYKNERVQREANEAAQAVLKNKGLPEGSPLMRAMQQGQIPMPAGGIYDRL